MHRRLAGRATPLVHARLLIAGGDTISWFSSSRHDLRRPLASAARLADVEDPKPVLRPRGLTAEIVAAIGQVPNSRDANQENIPPPSAAL